MIHQCKPRMVHVWLWKLQMKPKLLALLDQHLPPEDAVQLRSCSSHILDFDLQNCFRVIDWSGHGLAMVSCHGLVMDLSSTLSRCLLSLTHLLCRKALANHEAFRLHFGGRPFTPAAVKQSLKVADGQPWVACHLSQHNCASSVIQFTWACE